MSENATTSGSLATDKTILYDAIEEAANKNPNPDVLVPFACYLLNQVSRQIAFGKSTLSFSLARIQSILDGAADSSIYGSRTDYKIYDISNAWSMLSERFQDVLSDAWIGDVQIEKVRSTRVRLFVPATMLFSRSMEPQRYSSDLLCSSILPIPMSTRESLLRLLREWKSTSISATSDKETWAQLVCAQNGKSNADKWRNEKQGGLIGVQPHADTLILPYALSQLMVPQAQSIRDPSVTKHPSVPFSYSLAADCGNPIEWGDFHFIPFSHFGDIRRYPMPDILICTKELAETRLAQDGNRYALAKIELDIPEHQTCWRDENTPLRSLYRPVERLDVDYLSSDNHASVTRDIPAHEADQFHLPIAWVSNRSQKGEPYFRFSMIGGYSDTAVEAFNGEMEKKRIRLIESDLFDNGLPEFFSYEEQRILLWFFSRLELNQVFVGPTSDGYTWALDSGLCLGIRDQHRFTGFANDVQSYRFYGAGGHRINPLCVAVRCGSEQGPKGELAFERSEKLASALASLCSDFRRQMGALIGSEESGGMHMPTWQSGSAVQKLKCAMLGIFSGAHGVRSGVLQSMAPEAFIGNVAFPNSFYRRQARWVELLRQVLQQQSVHSDKEPVSSTG